MPAPLHSGVGYLTKSKPDATAGSPAPDARAPPMASAAATTTSVSRDRSVIRRGAKDVMKARNAPVHPNLRCLAPGAPAPVVRAGLDAAAAHRHRAPGGARVARAVVERPAADVARTGLHPRPAAVEHRRERGGDDAAERALDTAAAGDELRALGRERRPQLGGGRSRVERGAGGGILRRAVVGVH